MIKLKIDSTEFEKSKHVILLGITINKLLTLSEDIDNLCHRVNYKIHTLQEWEKSYP